MPTTANQSLSAKTVVIDRADLCAAMVAICRAELECRVRCAWGLARVGPLDVVVNDPDDLTASFRDAVLRLCPAVFRGPERFIPAPAIPQPDLGAAVEVLEPSPAGVHPERSVEVAHAEEAGVTESAHESVVEEALEEPTPIRGWGDDDEEEASGGRIVTAAELAMLLNDTAA